MSRRLKVGIIAGEESGDLLGADLISALETMTGKPVEMVGVGGRHLQGLGLAPLFDPSEIAIMGVTAVVKDLPRLLWRIGTTARAIAAARPDVLITIDSPDFSLRVARKVRALVPDIRIVHYVCPSVWAWRPGRARAMKAYVDRILCVLPFEPAELRRLDGPAGIFVGHRLSEMQGIRDAAAAQQVYRPEASGAKRLVILPGSRRAEVRGLMEPYRKAVEILAARMDGPLSLVLPTVPNLAALVGEMSADWPIRPEIVVEAADKWRAFSEADAALAASGTVLVELALARLPYVACYKTDFVVRALLGKFITVWSASLPNLIADYPVAFEYYDEFIRPGHVARQLERLMQTGPIRQAAIAGFDDVARKMRVDEPPGQAAARVVLDLRRAGPAQ